MAGVGNAAYDASEDDVHVYSNVMDEVCKSKKVQETNEKRIFEKFEILNRRMIIFMGIVIGLCVLIFICLAALGISILATKKENPKETEAKTQASPTEESLPTASDCSELLNRGHVKSGIYTLDGVKQVWCDMDTNFGGWTTITKRVDGKVNFRRNWNEYAAGFGNVSREYWIGNNQMNKMSAKRQDWVLRRQDWVLRIDIWDSNNKHTYGEWDNFFISSEAEKYKINFGSYRGNLIDGKGMDTHRGMKFTTKDQDNDNYAANCANTPFGLRGGWWFSDCFAVDLTMGYKDTGLFNGLFINGYVYIKAAEMKMRPMKF